MSFNKLYWSIKYSKIVFALLLVLLVFLVLLSWSDGNNSSAENKTWSQYTDAADNFSLKYPSTWHHEPSNNKWINAVFKDSTGKEVNISIQDISSTMTLSEFTSNSKLQINNLVDSISIYYSNDTDFMKHKAHAISFAGFLNGKYCKIKQVWFLHSGKAYVLTGKSGLQMSSDEELFNEIFRSFQFLK